MRWCPRMFVSLLVRQDGGGSLPTNIASRQKQKRIFQCLKGRLRTHSNPSNTTEFNRPPVEMIHLCIFPSHKFTHTLFIPLSIRCGLSFKTIPLSRIVYHPLPLQMTFGDFLFGFAFRMTPCRVLFFAHILSTLTSKE